MGIITISMMAMVGLAPVGLDTMRAAMNDTLQSQIAQSVASDAMLTAFSKLDDFASKSPYYFDEFGTRQAAQDKDTHFIATVTRLTTVYPGSTLANNLSNSVSTLQVQIQIKPGNQPPQSYVFHVPNQGE